MRARLAQSCKPGGPTRLGLSFHPDDGSYSLDSHSDYLRSLKSSEEGGGGSLSCPILCLSPVSDSSWRWPTTWHRMDGGT